jgi:hypothetical protein
LTTRGDAGKLRPVQDNRKFRRLPVDPLPARVLQEGRVIDLSIAGAFMMSSKPLPSGSQITLEIELPGDRTVRAASVVEWSGDYFRGEGLQPLSGMGLRFVDIDPADRIAITRFLTRRYETAQAAVRVPTKLPARVGDEGNWIAGSVREIGERTLFIETAATAAVGTELDIQIRFPNFRAAVAARGVVLEVVTADAWGPADGRSPAAGLDRRAGGVAGLLIELREVTSRGRDVMNVYLDEARDQAGPAPDGG